MKKADFLLIFIIFMLAAGSFFYLHNAPPAVYLTAKCGGKIILSVPLSRLAQVTQLDTPYGIITLQKTSGGIAAVSSPCPDKLCIRQGSIKNSGETIICLPCRTIITLTNPTESDAYDAVTN